MDAGGINPAVVEVEEGADGDGVVDLLVGPAGLVQGGHVFGGDVGGIVIHFVEEAKEDFLGGRQGGGFEVREDGFDESGILEEFRRDRGVGVCSKGAVVAF